MFARIFLGMSFLVLCCALYPAYANAEVDRPNVAYTGIFLMGDKQAESHFPIYSRNKGRLRDELRVAVKQVNEQGKLPFNLMFDSNIEDLKQHIDTTLSLALLVVRDDINSENFNAAGTHINKTIVNIGLVGILYDTRKVNGKDRNTIIYSFPLVGYAQRLGGEQQCVDAEIDALFVESAVKTVRDYLIKRLAGVSVQDIYGEVTDVAKGTATISIGAVKGIEDGQNVAFLVDDKKVAGGQIIKLGKLNAEVELPPKSSVKVGMKVKANNIRAVSDETFQVVSAKISSKKAAKYFPPEIIGPQVAQWFSNFLTERGGKVVQPSCVGGAWVDRASAETFKILDQTGLEYQFELPNPKYPVVLDITGVSSKVTESNDVNDVCLYKAWIKLTIPSKKYEKEFDLTSSKCQIKGVQSFEEKDELFDLLYQLTAKMAREAEI